MRTGIVLLLALMLAGCTLREHRMSPYDEDAAAAARVEERAVRACWLRRGDVLPPKEFRTDGCSMGPDSSWGECCVDHDIEYWCGGTGEERREADRALRECVGEKARWVAPIAYCMVRIGGASWTPFYWRWGYGW